MPEIKLVNITKKYGKKKVVDNLNLYIADGEYFILCGPTGSGKSTILKIIAGLVDPDDGEVYINGKIVNNVPPEKRGVGIVFETYALFPHMDVLENISFGPTVKGEDPEKIKNRAFEMLEMVLLEDRPDAYPGELSGGMKQRIALVRVLMTGSKILLLDEPLGALDAKIRMALRKDLKKMVNDHGLTAIHVTQDTEEAMMLGSKVAIIRDGQLMQVGSPMELYRHSNSLFVTNFISKCIFFEGTVTKTNEDYSEIGILAGPKIRVANTSYAVGDAVVVVIRSENLDISLEESSINNKLFGSVKNSQFIGGVIHYEIETDFGAIIHAESSALKDEIEIGNRVAVTFEREKTLVFPYYPNWKKDL